MNQGESDQRASSPEAYGADSIAEFDFQSLLAVLQSHKWTICAVTGFFAVLSVVVALQLPDRYESTAIVAPASAERNALGLSSQFSGLAALAGVNLKLGGEGDELQIAMEALQSWGFIEKFIQQNNIQVEVFAAEGWDRASNRLLLDEELYDAANSRWVRKPANGKSAAPSSWELYEQFSKMLTVAQDTKTGLISVSVEYYSPIIAKQWVDKLVNAINEHMRLRKLESSARNIKYLQEQIDKTALADMKSVFYQLIQSETKNLMLAEASPEYQFVTASPAMIAEQKASPKRTIIVVVGSMMGAMLAVFWLLVRRALARTKHSH